MSEAWRGQTARKAVASLGAAAVICGIIIWHVLHWHSSGMYAEMFTWTGTDRVYLAVLYNLGLMIAAGVILSLLIGKITWLLRYVHQRIEPADNRGKDNGGL